MTATSFVASAAALDLALRATLLIGAGWVAAAMLKRLGASAAARHLAWLLCIATLLALPIAWWLAPPLRVPLLPVEAAAAAPAAAALPGEVAAVALAESVDGSAPIAAWLLLAIYLTGVAALLLRLAASHVLLARLWREAGPAQAPHWQDSVACLSRELRLSQPVELRIARGPVMPMTWGTLAPKILLPAEAHDWSADRRLFVLLHELAHVARRDSLGRTAAAVTCALYWFHPGAWFAARRMRLEQEFAADDRVLALGAPARGYALSLLDLARRIGETPQPGHAAAMAGACQLERRVLAITTPARRDQPGLAFLSFTAAAGTLAMLVTATVMPVRPLSEPLDAPSIEPVSSTARSLPAADEGRASEPETAFRRVGARPQDLPGGGQAQRFAAPRAPGQPRRAGGAQIGSSASVEAAAPRDSGGQDMPNVLAAMPQREVYGPRLPREPGTEQAFDPRIPEPLRSRNPRLPPQDDNAAGRTTGHRIVRGVLRVLPAFLMASSDTMP